MTNSPWSRRLVMKAVKDGKIEAMAINLPGGVPRDIGIFLSRAL